MNIEKINGEEFLSRMVGCLIANAVITATEEHTDKKPIAWAVLPFGRSCSPMTYVHIFKPKWWKWFVEAEYGTATRKVTARLTRKQARLVREMIVDAQLAYEVASENPWETVDL